MRQGGREEEEGAHTWKLLELELELEPELEPELELELVLALVLELEDRGSRHAMSCVARESTAAATRAVAAGSMRSTRVRVLTAVSGSLIRSALQQALGQCVRGVIYVGMILDARGN